MSDQEKKDRLWKATLAALGFTEEQLEKSPALKEWVFDAVTRLGRAGLLAKRMQKHLNKHGLDPQDERKTNMDEPNELTETPTPFHTCASSGCSNRRLEGMKYCNACQAEWVLKHPGVPMTVPAASGVDWGELSERGLKVNVAVYGVKPDDEPAEPESMPNEPAEPEEKKPDKTPTREQLFERLHDRMFPDLPRRKLMSENLRFEAAECPEGCLYFVRDGMVPEDGKCELHRLELSPRTRFMGLASGRPVWEHIARLERDADHSKSMKRNWSLLRDGLRKIDAHARRLGTLGTDRGPFLRDCELFEVGTGSDLDSSVGAGESVILPLNSDGPWYKPLYIAGFALPPLREDRMRPVRIQRVLCQQYRVAPTPLVVDKNPVWIGTKGLPFGSHPGHALEIHVKNPLQLAANLYVRVWAMEKEKFEIAMRRRVLR